MRRCGTYVATLILLVGVVGQADANLVVNGGFETTEPVGGAFPTTFGDWTIDVSEIVTVQNGITPFEGSQMLHFTDTFFDGIPSSASGSDVGQLVDMSPLSGAIAGGLATALASAHFNRVVGDVQTDTQFAVAIRAYSGSPSDFPSVLGTPLASAIATTVTDGDLATWESVSVELVLPTGTDYLEPQ
jgi:hypothetical protein